MDDIIGSMSALLKINIFTDPQCPFAYSSEPIRLRLKWLFGDQIEWNNTFIILSGYGGEEATITPEMAAKYQAQIRDNYGMPMNVITRDRKVESATATRHLIAAKLYFPSEYENLLRQFRLGAMNGQYIDKQSTIDKLVNEAGINIEEMSKMIHASEVDEKIAEDFEASRMPALYAQAFSHKLSKTSTGITRYSAPSYQFYKDDSLAAELPGFWSLEAYEAMIGNIRPDIKRQNSSPSIQKVLEWADFPLATAEIAMIFQKSINEVEVQLKKIAVEHPFGQDRFWSLRS